jgi:hypothetical protein
MSTALNCQVVKQHEYSKIKFKNGILMIVPPTGRNSNSLFGILVTGLLYTLSTNLEFDKYVSVRAILIIETSRS